MASLVECSVGYRVGMPDNTKEKQHITETLALETEGPPFKLARAKMATLSGAVAGLIMLALSLSQGKSIANTAHLVITSALIFWFIGWCTAFLINRYIRVARRRLAEQQTNCIENGQQANDENAKEETMGKRGEAGPVQPGETEV